MIGFFKDELPTTESGNMIFGAAIAFLFLVLLFGFIFIISDLLSNLVEINKKLTTLPIKIIDEKPKEDLPLMKIDTENVKIND